MEALEVISPDVAVQLQRAETETMIDIAKRYPRDLKKAKQNLLVMATCDEETAQTCFYKKPVTNNPEDKPAEGPSIRLAEIAVNCYGNIRYGTRVIDETEKSITVQGFCFDLENNLAYTAEQKRSIWSDKGKGYRYSQNLIRTTEKAAAAIALRDAVFKVVPLGVFSAELKKIKAKAIGKDSGVPLAMRITKAFAYFQKHNVSEDRILERLNIHGKEEMDESHLETLIGLSTAIEDNDLTPEEAFPFAKKEQAENKAHEAAAAAREFMPDKTGQAKML